MHQKYRLCKGTWGFQGKCMPHVIHKMLMSSLKHLAVCRRATWLQWVPCAIQCDSWYHNFWSCCEFFLKMLQSYIAICRSVYMAVGVNNNVHKVGIIE